MLDQEADAPFEKKLLDFPFLTHSFASKSITNRFQFLFPIA